MVLSVPKSFMFVCGLPDGAPQLTEVEGTVLAGLQRCQHLPLLGGGGEGPPPRRTGFYLCA
eukprot:6152854-Pyramimonas_sp.AAC.1